MRTKKITVGDDIEIQIGKHKGLFGIVSMIIIIAGSGNRYQVDNTNGLLGYFRYHELKKAKTCDMCGQLFSGESYKVVDENFRPQKGLKSCGCNMDMPDGPQQHP